MIKDTEVEIKGHSSNYRYYGDLGYDVQIRKPFKVRPIHLMKGSSVKITSVCDNCLNETKTVFKDYWNYTNGLVNPYFCKNCNYINSEKTSLENWGFTNPMKSEEVKEILRSSLLDKYGVDWYSKTNEWKDKFRKTSLENWGVDNPSKSKDVIDRIISKNNSRLGVDWPMKSFVVLEKSRQTSQRNWGVDRYSMRDGWKKELKAISQSKFGFDNYSQTDECKDKVRNTNDIKWGGSPMKRDFFKNKSKIAKERNTYKRYVSLIGEKYDFLSYSDEKFVLNHKECGYQFSINKGLLLSRYKLDRMICVECNPIGVQYSSIETEIIKFLDLNGIEHEKNTKKVLGGLEIDIYIPSHNLAIEVNGVYWHSELFKSSDYHLKKTLGCRELEIDLIHVWEDDWNRSKEIVKSIILNKVGISSEKIWARKCSIGVVDTKVYRKFLEENHIQGYASSSIYIGLYYNGELVSLMTFGWRRTNNKREFELIRFCNKKNLIVVGGASRLFKYFLDNNKVGEIISYSDISIFSGKIYDSLGFSKVSLSKPNYFWVVDGVRRHRYNYSKRKLIKLGFDSNKTEVEIMHERGYYRIFSTGQEKWVYYSNTIYPRLDNL